MKMKNTLIVIAGCSLIVLAAPGYAEMDSSIARGGQLYDKWFAVIGVDKPKETHPAWPASPWRGASRRRRRSRPAACRGHRSNSGHPGG